MNALRIATTGLLAVALSGGLAACSPVYGAEPVFRINGHCTTKEGTLRGIGSGFSDSSTYQTTVYRPDGSEYDGDYTRYANTDEFGTIKTWSWPCEGDGAGTYKVTILDLASKKTAEASFTIDKG